MISTLKNILSQKIVLQHFPNESTIGSDKVILKLNHCEQLLKLNEILLNVCSYFNFHYIPEYSEIKFPSNTLNQGLNPQEINLLNYIFESNKRNILKNDHIVCTPRVQIDIHNKTLKLLLICEI